MTKRKQQYGTWSSPISPKGLAGSLKLNDVQWDTDSDTLVWLEGRGGQNILVAQTGDDAPRDLTDSSFSGRGGVGYGGGAFTVSHGSVYFSTGERLYRVAIDGGKPKAISPKFGSAAAPRVSHDGQWVAFVHSYEHVDGLALVDTAGKHWSRKLAYGTDFVMQPTWHPDGTAIAYIVWDHPQMPWNGTELRVATLDYDAQGIPYVTGVDTLIGDTETAIFQPEFSPDGRYLSYISDETGFGQLYIYDLQAKAHVQLTTNDIEHGQPAWVQGMRTYGWSGDSGATYYLENDKGFYSLHRYDLEQRTSTQVAGLDDYTALQQIAVSPVTDAVALLGAASKIPQRILTIQNDRVQIRKRSMTEAIPPDDLADAQAITWTGHDGGDVYGLYYPPTSSQYDGTGKPPLVIDVHGGPTSQVTATYNGQAQFFATRGYAVLEVNHRGSTGYGKDYMNMHAGNWGIYDVEDSVTGANYLVEQGLADADKIIIMGGSAGGFTVLQSLVDKPGFYKGAICKYGVANQFGLVMDTHKFEERYSYWLLGELPDAAEKYRARSPLFHAEKIEDAIIVFQGEDDKVVPKNQSDSIVESLAARGVPHEYHVYTGEGHGWRKPETIEDYYNKCLKFLLEYVIYA